MTHFRHAAIAAALLVDVGTASAQTTVITREPVETRTLVTMQPLELTPVQRQTIYRTIIRQPVETVQRRRGAGGQNLQIHAGEQPRCAGRSGHQRSGSGLRRLDALTQGGNGPVLRRRAVFFKALNLP